VRIGWRRVCRGKVGGGGLLSGLVGLGRLGRGGRGSWKFGGGFRRGGVRGCRALVFLGHPWWMGGCGSIGWCRRVGYEGLRKGDAMR
jgi:hypothetical protein